MSSVRGWSLIAQIDWCWLLLWLICLSLHFNPDRPTFILLDLVFIVLFCRGFLILFSLILFLFFWNFPAIFSYPSRKILTKIYHRETFYFFLLEGNMRDLEKSFFRPEISQKTMESPPPSLSIHKGSSVSNTTLYVYTTSFIVSHA